MTVVENLPSPRDRAPDRLRSLKRKEDARFIRGKGNYLDDIRLPGMVYGALLRSPYAHARISRSTPRGPSPTPTSRRSSPPRTSRRLGLAWMPTISYDTQAVLAGDKVRFQGQEVAFVIATDEYSANDALGLIDVEYEPLPAIVNARKALDPDAPLIRDDKAGQRDNLASPTWEAGDQAAPTARSRRPTPLSCATSSIRAAIQRRSRRAASSPTSIPRPASSTSTTATRRRMRTAPSTRTLRDSPST